MHAYYSNYQREITGSVLVVTLVSGETVQCTMTTIVPPHILSVIDDFRYVGEIGDGPIQTIVEDYEIYRLYQKIQMESAEDTPESRLEMVRMMGRQQTALLLLQCGVWPANAMRSAIGTPDGYRAGVAIQHGIN